MKRSELRAEQAVMRHKNSLEARQAAMFKRWAKRREREQAEIVLKDSFRDRFFELCRTCQIDENRALQMWYAILFRPIARDVRTLQALRSEYGPELVSGVLRRGTIALDVKQKFRSGEVRVVDQSSRTLLVAS
jgi:hypothetical protein